MARLRNPDYFRNPLCPFLIFPWIALLSPNVAHCQVRPPPRPLFMRRLHMSVTIILQYNLWAGCHFIARDLMLHILKWWAFATFVAPFPPSPHLRAMLHTTFPLSHSAPGHAVCSRDLALLTSPPWVSLCYSNFTLPLIVFTFFPNRTLCFLHGQTLLALHSIPPPPFSQHIPPAYRIGPEDTSLHIDGPRSPLTFPSLFSSVPSWICSSLTQQVTAIFQTMWACAPPSRPTLFLQLIGHHSLPPWFFLQFLFAAPFLQSLLLFISSSIHTAPFLGFLYPLSHTLTLICLLFPT